MDLLKTICNELNITVCEEWFGNDGNIYVINELYDLICIDSEGCMCVVNYKDLLTGDLKPQWKPNNGDVYYIPKIDSDIQKWEHRLWGHNEIKDNTAWDRGLVCQTKEEANKLTIKMLRALE